MQPYFMPYIGYFQLIAAVDLFIVYDDVKYTKKGWINRNRLLQEGRAATFTLPLKGDSDRLEVRQRELAADFRRDKLLNQLRNAYRRAPCFAQTFPLIEQIVRHDDVNLFGFLHHSIARTCAHLGTTTPIELSSAIAIDPGLKAQDRVLALCRAVGATTYVNASGGTELYAAPAFRRRGIDLKFIRPGPLEYGQFGDPFVPWLSIIDVMMFNPPAAIQAHIVNAYRLI